MSGLDTIIEGVLLGGVYALFALGLSLIFGVLRIVNFAHGEFYMLGAYVAFTLTERFSGAFGFWGGIVIAALNFAWQHARELYADSDMQADGSKLYRVQGTLFFASCTTFLAQFEPADDPQQVTLDCRHLSFVDYSAIAALKTLRERYERAGKHLRVVHLSERCKQLLKRAGE